MIFQENFKLSNGIEIPKLAIGTWLINNDKVKDVVKEAVAIGYRHIDTAQAYENEQGVGEGIRSSGISRDKIFITSKVAAEIKSYSSASESIDKTLKTMGLDYIDMMIIHCPQPWAEYNKSDNRYFEENTEVWKSLENSLKSGKIRAIGVSNFLKEDIENILKTCEIKPMVNQIQAHIANTPFELIDYCQKQNIIVEAYSPIAHGKALKNQVITAMAEKYRVSAAQICIRYDWQLDMVVLPKASSHEHIKNNSQLDFVISDDDMNLLKNLKDF